MAKKAEIKIPAVLTPEIVAEIQNHINEIKKLTEKTVESYVETKKTGKINQIFDQASMPKVLEVMEKYPQFIPPYVDSSESKTDLINFEQLMNLSSILKKMAEKYSKTSFAAHKTAQTVVVAYHKTVKQAMKLEVENAKLAFDELELIKK